ncbi:MAG: hypothetical protein UU77_C0005G0003 [candidate division WWE3 bacterium GW2011_GWC1_41_7]|uniref:Ig-like domain-containing protein n=1 Tax=candidate division WWE3 bacterium GW2011_GWC1_41_7 TaxID=1619119 RepID=A0A0G0X8N2_UNCKA|nr:MAG: hypothetical protein UU77_C0005G0003 [candidate division WWE3 bacterium GW2011_GWC1_41_7]
MIKKLLVLTLIFALAGVALYVGAGRATANEGAVVIKDDGCLLFDGDGDLVQADSNVRVETKSNKDNALTSCKASDVDPSTQGAVIFNYENTGLPCFTTAGLTNDWQNVVTPSGQSSLSCHYKN